MENTGGGEPNATDSIDVLKCLRCGQEGCSNVPAFGYHGEGPTLCSEHATPVMVQLVALRCEQAGCNARRTFGFDGGEARLCANHKLEGMVDLMKRRSQASVVLRGHGERLFFGLSRAYFFFKGQEAPIHVCFQCCSTSPLRDSHCVLRPSRNRLARILY